MISVILCTFNGSKYIEKQLESIKNQTVMPDEVIIQDDCSTDDTIPICNRFISDNNLSWNIIINPKRKGYRLNFITGLKKTRGNIVFLCDQDDVWLPNKVEEMTKCIKGNAQIKSLATTVDRIDENGEVFEEHLSHPHINKNGLKKLTAKEFYRFPNYMGMTMAVKRELIDNIDDKYADIITHDILCNYYAVRMEGLYFLDKVFTNRRSVGENISYIEKENDLVDKYHGNLQLRLVVEKKKILECFETIDNSKDSQEDIELEKNINCLNLRKSYLEKRSIKKLICNSFKVARINGAKELAKDLLAIIKGA